MINCEHPKIILSPCIADLLSKYHKYCLFGTWYNYPWKYRAYYYLDKRVFYNVIDRVTQGNINECFVVDERTGEQFNVFLCVPCGKCDLCRERKMNDFVQRCKLESECYDTLPLYATLTYDNKHRPENGVNVRDTQLFLKRLRINLFRHGYFKPIRYAITGHYGDRTHREHYHIIIWNFAPTDYSSAEELLFILQQSWNNGEVRRPRWIDNIDDKCFYYTCRYLCKEHSVPEGANPAFLNTSRLGGGIGKRKLKEFAVSFRRRPNLHFKFRSKWSSTPVPLRFNKYVLDTLLPSYCTSIPSEFRTSCRLFRIYYEVFTFYHPDLKFIFEDTNEKLKYYENLFYFAPLVDMDIPSSYYHDDALVYGQLLVSERRILKYVPRLHAVDFIEAEETDQARKAFLGDPRFIEQLTADQLRSRAYRCRRKHSRKSYSEVL